MSLRGQLAVDTASTVSKSRQLMCQNKLSVLAAVFFDFCEPADSCFFTDSH